MLTEVLHQRPGRPSWEVGETKAERVERMRSDAESDSSRWYRDSYPRRIVSTRSVADVESGKLPSLRNMAGDMLGVRVMDLTAEDLKAARSGTMKVKGNGLVPVTFDERLGAIAVKLHERHADPEQWERDEKQRVKTEDADNEKRRKDNEFDAEVYRVRKADFPREMREWSKANPPEMSGEFMAINDSFPPLPPERPTPRQIREVAPSSFDAEVARIVKTLPPAGGVADE